MYIDKYSEELIKKLLKIKKRNPIEYFQIRKKIDSIIANPNHGYKFLTNNLKGINRIHIGHFVLIFRIKHQEQAIYFDDYDHHDIIYQK